MGWVRPARRIAVGFAIVYLVVTALLFAGQRFLLYVPDPRDPGPPADHGLTEFTIARPLTEDGSEGLLWIRSAKPGHPTLVVFHGNGGNIAYRARLFGGLARQGFGVVAVEYRGYGGLAGSPSEQGLYADARAALAFALVDLNVPPQQIVFYGESLGTGIAVEMAAANGAAALILQSPYTSIPDVAASILPWLPVHWLVRDRYDSAAKISRVMAPLLVLHGELDSVVPVRFGRALFDLAAESKEAVWYPDKGHNDLGYDIMAERAGAFLRAHGLVATPAL